MKKKMILVAAPPACGKTTVSDRLCRELRHVAYFDKDDYAGLIDLIFDLTGNRRDLDGVFYREKVRTAQYETLFHMAQVSLRYEDLVLLNAPFAAEVRHPEKMKKIRKRLKPAGAELVIVWVLASPEQCHERMLKRNGERDRGKLADWDSFVKTLDFSVPAGLMEENAADAFLVIDSTSAESYEKTIAEAVKRIRE